LNVAGPFPSEPVVVIDPAATVPTCTVLENVAGPESIKAGHVTELVKTPVVPVTGPLELTLEQVNPVQDKVPVSAKLVQLTAAP
jgi:hypothetical protein